MPDMYLRYTTRKKDGKVHRYWRLVRSVRVGRRVIQQTVAQLGELDEHGRIQARALARALIGEPEQAALFNDGTDHQSASVRLKAIRPALQVALHRRAELHVIAPASRVDVAIILPAAAPVDAGELVAAVIQHRLRQSPGRAVDLPPHQDGRAHVGPILIGEEHALVLEQVDDGVLAVVVGCA
jgi:hypothetical protein